MKPLPSAALSHRSDDVALAKRLYLILLVGCVVIGACIACYYLFIATDPTQRVCPLYRLTGVQCPSCGGSRAFAMLLKGDIAAAWRLNPNAVLSGIAVALLLAMSLYDFVASFSTSLRRHLLLPGVYRFFTSRPSKRRQAAIGALIAAAFVFEICVWLHNIYYNI